MDQRNASFFFKKKKKDFNAFRAEFIDLKKHLFSSKYEAQTRRSS